MKGTFFTQKRLDAVSKSSLTLGQALVIAIIAGGIFDKIASIKMRIVLSALTMSFFIVGVILADNQTLKE